MGPLPDSLSLSSWLERVREARTPEDIVNVVRRFMFCVPPEDVDNLPSECRDISIQDPASLSQWAVTFRQAELTSGQNLIDRDLLERLSALLSAASARLTTVATLGRTRSGAA
jgi:hypothetical protein